MKKNKLILKIIMIFMFIIVITVENENVLSASYDIFIKQAEEQLKTFNGMSNNDNTTEIIKSMSLIKQNPEATQQFLENISGSEFANLREWLGIDENGNISKDKAVNAVYGIASILDTNEYMCREGIETDGEGYVSKEYLLKEDKNNEFVLHKIQIGGNNGLQEQTWGFLNGIGGFAKDELKRYYDYFVSASNENGIIYKNYGEAGNYLKYDPDADVGNIEIATGDGEASTGTTANEAIEDAVNDIVNNSVVTRPNENVNTNVESSTGINVGDRINEYEFKFDNPKSDSEPSLTLENLTNRVTSLGTDGIKKLSDLVNFVGKDLIEIFQTIGTYLMYGAILFFGVRTIWSGATGKAQFKELLPYLLLGIVFFYLAEDVVNLATIIFDRHDYVNYASGLWRSVINIVKVLAFGGIIFTGIKFLFASSEGKADIKSSLFSILIGCILVFASSTVVSIVLDIAKGSGI